MFIIIVQKKENQRKRKIKSRKIDKKNKGIKEMDIEELKMGLVKQLLARMKEKFGEVDKESSKVKELRFLKQEKRICEEHIQIFKRTARESEYEGRVLIKECKRSFNRLIRRRLIKSKRPPRMVGE